MKKEHKSFLALAAFAAAGVFFGAEVFDATISDWPLQAAGLFSLALGLTLDHLKA